MAARMKYKTTISTHEAEKNHVRLMKCTDGLMVKPFLGGTSLNVEQAQVEMAVFSAIVASLPAGPGSFILDLGAGPCWMSEWLGKLKYKTCSLDICLDMLRMGRLRLQPESQLCVADMASIPFTDNSFDAAVCFAALHHVPNWPQVLGEVHRVLRPGGVFVMQEPGRGHGKRAESIMEMEQFGVLEQDLPARMLVRACREAGFTRTMVRPVAEMHHGLSRILPPYPLARKYPRLFVRKLLKFLLITTIERLLNLWTPLHLVVAAKGSPHADSRRPDTMLARFLKVDLPADLKTATPVPFRVCVENTGLTRWLSDAPDTSDGRVRLGMSLLDAEGKILDLDFFRVILPHDVHPGEAVELVGELPNFSSPGRAGLRLDMVSEGVCWFSERGSRAYFVTINIHE